MKKVALLLVIIMLLSMPLSIAAAPRGLSIEPTLSFNGTTAKCEVTVMGNNSSEYVEVTMKLMHGPYCVAIWHDSAYGYVDMHETTSPVIKGDTYTLVVQVKLNSVAFTPVSVTGVC